MQVVFFLNKLHPHVARDEYEAWVRRVDYPTAASIPSILEYKVTRIDGLLEGEQASAYDYIERVLITDLESYRRDLADPRLSDFATQWQSYVATSVAVRGTMIE
jgi:low affinity Fe/Cu permease